MPIFYKPHGISRMLVVDMDIFNQAFKATIGHEGGYIDDPKDKGGETKFGISKRSYPQIDIKSLSLIEAKSIYYNDFWNTKKCNLDFLPNLIAVELFDTGVNMGSVTALKMLQESLNLLNRVETRFNDLVVDGWIGSSTLGAVGKVKVKELLRVLNGLQFNRYLEIVKNDPSQERFFAGWIKRT